MPSRASESVSFPELVWAHYLYQRALHDEGELHGPAEEEFRSQLGRFVAENGPIVNAYWCTGEASAVALTEKPGERVLGFLWRQRPNIRLHAATDWATRDAPEINHALHTCETLAIRVSEVLSCTSERIAMQWLLSIAGLSAECRRRSREEDEPARARQGVEPGACRAGAGRALLRPGRREDRPARLLLGDADRSRRPCRPRRPRCADLQAVRQLQRGQREDVLHLLRDGRGRRDRQRDDADGVENRRRVRRLRGRATLPSAHRKLPADHRRRVRGRRLLRSEERPDHVEDVERADGLLLRHDRLHRGVQRAAGEDPPWRSREDARGRRVAKTLPGIRSRPAARKAHNGQTAGGPA